MTATAQPVPPDASRLRAAAHYLLAYALLSLYGTEVCPFVESLGTTRWLTVLGLCLGGMFLARTLLLGPLVRAAGLEKRVLRRFGMEWGVFIAGSLALTATNMLWHELPVESGLKVAAGFFLLGLFAALDLALADEREVVRSAADPLGLPDPGRIFPLTRKFALVSSLVTVLSGAVLVLIVVKDLEWMVLLEPEEIREGVLPILKEVGFITCILLGFLLNLILTFSRNLRLLFENQNGALLQVAQGRLDVSVPVGTNDEFGVMARYTNGMIDSLRRLNSELRLTRDVTILSLASLAETRDNETGAHILRTQRYVLALCEHLRTLSAYAPHLDEDTVDLLYKSAPLHDIGKVGVPDAILLKPGRLTDEEFAVMRRHPDLGREALLAAERKLGETGFLRHAKEIAWTHHEKWDGTGYPRGIAGEDIPLSGRLMALADVYDALITRRVYKEAFSHEKSRGIILAGRGTHFDPVVVDAFLAREEEFLRIAAEFGDRHEGQ